jgi:hypothetical protein
VQGAWAGAQSLQYVVRSISCARRPRGVVRLRSLMVLSTHRSGRARGESRASTAVLSGAGNVSPLRVEGANIHNFESHPLLPHPERLVWEELTKRGERVGQGSTKLFEGKAKTRRCDALTDARQRPISSSPRAAAWKVGRANTSLFLIALSPFCLQSVPLDCGRVTKFYSEVALQKREAEGTS